MKRKLQDYKIIKKIGSGAFGEILEVSAKDEGKQQSYAMKKISKEQIFKLNKLHEAFIQRQILLKFKKIQPQLFVTLHETQSDNDFIYMILQLCDGGSLDRIISKIKTLPNSHEVITNVIARMVATLQAMHTNKVIHRDLKPSNFLLLRDGTIKLADFGTAYAPLQFFPPEAAEQIKQFKQMAQKKKNEKMGEGELQQPPSPGVRRSTFVGTPLYMAPELLTQDFCGPEADLWALGCIIYQILHGKTPFEDQNEGKVWKKIIGQDFSIPVKSQQKQKPWQFKCESLISSLLIKQRFKRLGYGENGYDQLKKHSFFEGINWEQIKKKPIQQLGTLIKQEELLKSQTTTQISDDPQKVVFSGMVNKKMFFGNFKQRMLVLHALPKLVYYDTETGQKKGEILLKKETPIGTQGNKIFTITNEKKTFYFKSIKAHQWIEMIKLSLVNAFY